jgi:biotin carboxyl carrier protein
MRTSWKDGDRMREVVLEAQGAGKWRVRVDSAEFELSVEALPNGDLRLTNAADRAVALAEVTRAGSRCFVHLSGRDYVLERETSGRARGRANEGNLEAPMPGVVTRVLVGAGDEVKAGQPLVAIEAMKMEHVIRSPREGRVKSVAARAGEMVNPGIALVELDAPE